MYPNLFAEMFRQNLSGLKLLSLAGLKYSTVWPKLKHGGKITLDEAIKIRTALGVNTPLEELFKKAEAA